MTHEDGGGRGGDHDVCQRAQGLWRGAVSPVSGAGTGAARLAVGAGSGRVTRAGAGVAAPPLGCSVRVAGVAPAGGETSASSRAELWTLSWPGWVSRDRRRAGGMPVRGPTVTSTKTSSRMWLAEQWKTRA